MAADPNQRLDADFSAMPANVEPKEGLITLTYIIYGLHLFSAISGVLTPAFVLTSFLTGWPSIIAVILNYIKRDDTRGTWLESHFRWQIRTFWYSLMWLCIGMLLILTFFGIPLAFITFIVVGLWVLYRMIKGVMTLSDSKAMPWE